MSSRRCRVFSSLLIPSPSSRIHGQDAATPAPRREEERQRDRERGRDRSAATCAPLGLPSRALRALVAVLHDRGAFTASTRQGRLHAAKSSASETGSRSGARGGSAAGASSATGPRSRSATNKRRCALDYLARSFFSLFLARSVFLVGRFLTCGSRSPSVGPPRRARKCENKKRKVHFTGRVPLAISRLSQVMISR